MRKEDLVADHAPGGPTFRGLRELAVEPLLLAATHEGAGGVVGEIFAYVVVVPAETGYGAVVGTGVED